MVVLACRKKRKRQVSGKLKIANKRNKNTKTAVVEGAEGRGGMSEGRVVGLWTRA